ncbi:hypothetical protein EWM64_g863 [Hericium alpestre]|uniref:Uncharacterized protein n=1 Tax=Hericium alpestre TaxID=135208 RepID=A0A4Z0A9D0_9AGAM|nr:hypothetical protein EWM64_g863 [Hericium alpestre]
MSISSVQPPSRVSVSEFLAHWIASCSAASQGLNLDKGLIPDFVLHPVSVLTVLPTPGDRLFTAILTSALIKPGKEVRI